MWSEAAGQPNVWVERSRRMFHFFSHVAALVQVEAIKLFKDPAEMFIRAVQPILWLVVFGQAFAKIRILPVGAIDYTSFLAPGILAQSITFTSIFFGITLIWERDQGLTLKYLSTPIARPALVLGKLFSAGLRGLIQATIVLLVSWALGARLNWSFGSLAGVFLLTILGAAFFSGLSLGIAALVKTRDRMMGIGQLVTFPLFFASSALYPIEIMPEWLKVVSQFNPMTYLVDGLRNVLSVSVPSHFGVDALVLFVSTFVVTGLASWLYPRLVQ